MWMFSEVDPESVLMYTCFTQGLIPLISAFTPVQRPMVFSDFFISQNLPEQRDKRAQVWPGKARATGPVPTILAPLIFALRKCRMDVKEKKKKSGQKEQDTRTLEESTSLSTDKFLS